MTTFWKTPSNGFDRAPESRLLWGMPPLVAVLIKINGMVYLIRFIVIPTRDNCKESHSTYQYWKYTVSGIPVKRHPAATYLTILLFVLDFFEESKNKTVVL